MDKLDRLISWRYLYKTIHELLRLDVVQAVITDRCQHQGSRVAQRPMFFFPVTSAPQHR